MPDQLVNLEFTSRSSARQGVEPPPPRLARSPDALYLHVPFCFHKCHYCDFYSIVEPEGRDRQETFTTALLADLDRWHAEAPLRPRTIFVGGGTPTLLRVDLWERLLAAMHDRGVLREVAEFTVEANPETVTPELMRVLRAGGVNRVSMGAQSFQPELLKALERWHDPASVPRAAAVCRDACIENLNLDLIFAIPGQTLALLDADVDALIALEPTHLSCYGLTYEPNTAMTTKLRLGRVRPIEEDLEAQMYGHVIQRMAAAGFEHYEVSNWARPGRRCEHNLAYWHNRDWIGVGPSAASHVGGWRWKNEPHLGRYLAGSPTPPVVDVEHLDDERRLGEELMLRLRLREGVAEPWLRERLRPDDARWSVIAEMIGLGMLAWSGGRLALTPRGLFVADAVIARLL